MSRDSVSVRHIALELKVMLCPSGPVCSIGTVPSVRSFLPAYCAHLHGHTYTCAHETCFRAVTSRGTRHLGWTGRNESDSLVLHDRTLQGVRRRNPICRHCHLQGCWEAVGAPRMWLQGGALAWCAGVPEFQHHRGTGCDVVGC